MATVIQVTGTGFDSNVWGLIPDNDGTTCWAFNDTSVGNTIKYARFSLVDGSIVHAGNIFAGSKGLRSRTDAAVYWSQGDNGKYYAISTGTPTLYQFEISPSAGGSSEVLDTYSTTLNSMTVSGPTHMCAFTGSDGVRYVALMSSTLTVINADTWTLVGSFSPDGSHQPATAIGGQSCFVDKFGDLWGICLFNQSGGFLQMIHWHPADGALAGVLNATITEVPYPSGLSTVNEPSFFHYVESNHSILMDSEFGATNTDYTSDLYNMSLGTPGSPGTFVTNASLPSDGELVLNTFNYAFDDTDLEMTVTQPSGKLGVQSDTTGPAFNTQVGGIFKVLDPIALTIDGSKTVDVTQLILGTLLPAPTQGTYDASHGTGPTWYNQFADLVYSEINNSLAVTYAQTDFSTGSALYLISFGSPPSGVPFCAIPGGLFGF
jgi:hypothetical protein